MSRPTTRQKQGPILVKSGNVTVKIYPVKNRGRDLYTLTYRATNGDLVRRQFADLAKAKIEGEIAATKIQNGHVHVLELVDRDRDIYLHSQEVIRPTGERLDMAAANYAEAMRIIRGAGSVVEAARFFAKHHPVKLPAKTVFQVYEEFRHAKETDGVAMKYLQDIRSRLGRFAERFTGRILEITSLEIDAWLNGLELGGASRNATRALIITLFNFAKQRGYLPKNQPTEAESVSIAKEKPSEIGIFTPDQMTTLLSKAGDRFVPYLAIGGFAGLRHAELMRLHWDNVKLAQATIVVSAQAAKTSLRRTVPIQPNLHKWLSPFAKGGGVMFTGDGSRFLNHVTSIARENKLTWPHNGLRHSYASYRLAQCKNAAEVSLEMGNSPQMIFRHYRELVSLEDAAEWWAIEP
jgi:integrase